MVFHSEFDRQLVINSLLLLTNNNETLVNDALHSTYTFEDAIDYIFMMCKNKKLKSGIFYD